MIRLAILLTAVIGFGAPAFPAGEALAFKHFNVFKGVVTGIDFFASGRQAVTPYEKAIADARQRLAGLLGSELPKGAVFVCSTLQQKDSVYEPKALFAGSGQVSLGTLAPTAKALGLTAVPKDPRDPKGLAKEILADHAGTSVVVCWPAKALKPLALALGVPEPLAEWPEVWHQIWVIRLDAKGGAIDTGSQAAPPDPHVVSGYAVVWGDRK